MPSPQFILASLRRTIATIVVCVDSGLYFFFLLQPAWDTICQQALHIVRLDVAALHAAKVHDLCATTSALKVEAMTIVLFFCVCFLLGVRD